MSQISLFPLNLVLVPGALLPLHIFEERYRDMIARCLAEETEFGITWEQQEDSPQESGENAAPTRSWAQIGCSARILKVLERYPDGRMDILTRGEQRFVIEALDLESEIYAQARVEFFDDEPADEPSLSERDELLHLHRRILAFQGRNTEVPEDEPAADLAFVLCQNLDEHLSLKQHLLALRSAEARVRYLTGYYQRLLPLLEQARTVQRRISGNGHLRGIRGPSG